MSTKELQNILIVDDEPINQTIAMEILEGVAEIKIASSGEEAFTIIQDFTPDLILLDIMMPGMDGYEVCKLIKEDLQLSQSKVILISGKAMDHERLKGYEVGADDYITKPYHCEEFIARCKIFLRLSAVERQYRELNKSLEKRVEERTHQLIAAELSLMASAKMAALGEMAGGIAHEINNPLATIGMISEQITELTQKTDKNYSSILELTELLSRSVQRISKIIKGLKTFSRDGSQDRFESIFLYPVIDDTLRLCAEKFKHLSIQVDLTGIPPEIQIECQSVQISQVFLNLFSNSCDAIEHLDKKWIKIEAKDLGDRVEIRFLDSGAGISADVREKIFNPFFTTKGVGKGTGLGLSISKGVLQSNNGTIDLDPTSQNTCFTIQLKKHQTGQLI